MRLSVLTPLLLSAYCFAGEYAFRGQLTHLPTDALQHQQKYSDRVLNAFQSRIDVDLVSMEGPSFPSTKGLVDRSYAFSFDGLSAGEYELHVNSYDLLLTANRFRIQIDAETGSIKAFEDYLDKRGLNTSSVQVLGADRPLSIKIDGYKDYYEQQQGGVLAILADSPLGFIFKNRTYTIIFFACVGMMLFPWVLSMVSPELAKELEDVKKNANDKFAERNAPVQAAPATAKTTQSRPQSSSGLRQRK